MRIFLGIYEEKAYREACQVFCKREMSALKELEKKPETQEVLEEIRAIKRIIREIMEGEIPP